MDSSVGQTIERIKLQEQDNEVKLREKRELKNAVLSTNRAIRDTLTHHGKLLKEYQYLTLATDKLLHQLTVETTRYHALVYQVESCCRELEDLREQSSDGVSTVWNKRSKLLETIQGIADKCDIWALLIKPSCNETVPCVKKNENNDQLLHDDSKLRNSLERRQKALAERNYLLSEPEVGEEFVRIRLLSAAMNDEVIKSSIGNLVKQLMAKKPLKN